MAAQPGGVRALLAELDSDRRLASQKYEQLRRRLVDFFSWERSPSPEDLADEALDRLAKRIREGAQIADLNRYVAGIARLVFRESLLDNQRRQAALRDLPRTGAHAVETPDERTAPCLKRCMERLPGHSRDLILRYYTGDQRARIEVRRQLAEELGVSLNAVRNRAQRIRDRLQACVERCVAAQDRDT